MTLLRPAPPDATCDIAWETIVALAREHCLVVQAHGGVMVLATPAAQREEPGLRPRVLAMHRATESVEGQ